VDQLIEDLVVLELAVVAELLAVVSEDDDGRVRGPRPLEHGLEGPAQLSVHVRDLAVVEDPTGTSRPRRCS
jgi:hypothetical protein